MFRNYLRTAFRNILRYKGFSTIVITGLTIGIAIFALVFLYVNQELSYDRFNENYDRIYRLENGEWALTGTAYAPEIAQQFPEVISSTRVSIWEGMEATIKIHDHLMKINNLIYADSGFFNIFSFRFIKGNPKHAMDDPNAIVLTESMARKIFGDEDPINKSFMINNKVTYTVTGIIKDVKRFHIQVNAVASFISLYDSWNYYTYFTLKDKTDATVLTDKLNDFYTNRASWPDSRPEFLLRPLREIYFTPVKYDMASNKSS